MAKLYVFLAVAAVALGLTSALTEEEKNAFREGLLPVLTQCAKEFSITTEDIFAAKKTGTTETLDSCLQACFFKKIGAINDAGLFDPDVALEKYKKFVKGEDDLKTIAAISQTCKAVNDQAVSDGAKGCDRSKLLLSCLIQENSLIFFPLA